ncbi:MAG: FAD-dependent oxidoreductase [Cellvibrionales bacterium]|nr:FAD-dependent oxidoreductase [Cellvibrionales bacterium]
MTNTKMRPANFDVVIIGGGIHGAGIAQACSAAGYSCLLLEKKTWASATSSKSSKLLHGGLRYLQTGQLKLVRECLQERERLLKNAPSLARINQFYIPIYKHSKLPAWKIFIGLSLYRLLAGFTNTHSQFRIIPRKQWHTLGGLNTKNLFAVFSYQDAQTDDKLLTIAVKNSAESLSCVALEQAELLSAIQGKSGWLLDIHHKKTVKTMQGSLLINASGPWVNDVINRCGRSEHLDVELVQGTHIVLNKKISDACFYLEADDRRAVFVLPWHEKTLVGTTETPYQTAPENTAPTEKEIQYLLKTVKQYFPDADLSIASHFSGLRVLPTSEQKAFFRQRDTRFLDDDGLISVYGGKLTAYRATAEKLLPLVQKYLGKRQQKADTRDLPLHHPSAIDN